MTELETLVKLLAFQLGENIHLRDALVETMLAFMEEEGQRGVAGTGRHSYLDLLKQIEQQRLQIDQEGKDRINAALHRLCDQIRDELRQATLSLHRVLRSRQFEPDEDLVRKVGVNVKNFPAGFPQGVSLLKLSESYIGDVRDAHFLQTHFPGKVPRVAQNIEKTRQYAARQIQDLAWKALSTGLFTDIELLNFHDACRTVIQSLEPTAKNRLLEILQEAKKLRSSELLHNVEDWLHTFGGAVSQQVLKDLSAKQKRLLITLLIRTGDSMTLKGLIALDPGAEEKDLFETLMTLRFGEEFQNSLDAWQVWLKSKIDEATQAEQALTFWKEQHPYSIPALLLEHGHPPGPLQRRSVEIAESLSVKGLEQIGATTLEELIESRASMMTSAERHILEEALSIQQKKREVVEEQFPESLEFNLEETFEAAPEEQQEEQPGISQLVGGAVETAMDYAVEGNLLESTIATAIDKGSEAFDEQLTVTLEEEETPAELTPQIHFKPIPDKVEGPKKPRTEVEPAENIWGKHIFPFVRKNLVIAVGVSLLFIGSLLLVFTMWDKAAWIRYGVAPFMIVGIAFFLSLMGLWLKKQDIKSDVPIAIIQSAAIFLAPMSLLFVALLSVESELSLGVRIIWGIFLSTALLAAWGFIFSLSIKTVHRAMAGIHGYTLLFLNALLLLLPAAQLSMSPEDTTLTLGTRGILVIGFYSGFLVLCWSMRKILGRMMEKTETGVRIPMVFYSVTCLGTFALVWGLTHARLMILPQPYTYGPLLLLFSFLISMIEFRFLEIREQTGRITSLSYIAYFFIGLGVLLSISHDYVRVAALLLAGLVWFYQAFKLGDKRHFNISMVILTGAFSAIALVRDFPAPFFPYLAIIVISGLYVISLTFPYEEVAILAARLSPIYMSFAFVVSILWQWSQNIPPLSYGFAFVIFGIFSVYLGAKTDKQIHVHAGAGYIVAALPYLGSVDMNLYTLKDNTLVFGLALVGALWTMMSSALQTPAIKDSRSTVLWNIGILAFCIMCLRVIFEETFDPSANPFLQFQILSGPVIIAGLMLLAGYFTRSYVSVYLALVILVIIFPEIKDRFNIPMYSGLGSTMSGIGFLTLSFVLGRWKVLQKEKSHDLIWRKKPFPFQAKNYYLLFANPIVVSAFFLFTRTIFVIYPKNYFRPLMPFSIRTLIAVALSGTAYHFFSVWFRKRWFSYTFSYIGFIAIIFSIVHSCYIETEIDYFDPLFLPVFILAAFVYCELIMVVSFWILTAEKAAWITNPFRHLKYLTLWISALGFYLFYSFYYADIYQTTFALYWVPLLFYLCIISVWLTWNAKPVNTSWFFAIPAYLLFWQLVTLVTTLGNYLPYVLEPYSRWYFSTSLMALGIVSSFLVLEHFLTKERFQALSPMLWISGVLLLLFSPLLTMAFYGIPDEFTQLPSQIIVWALVSFVIGRFLNIGPLWLWSGFLFHLLFLRYFEGEGLTRLYLSFHPFTLACIAIFWSALSIITAKVKWLYEHKHSYPWVRNRWLSPSFLFAGVSHLVVALVFLQAVNPDYRYRWMTVMGLFLAALPALFAAHQLGFSQHFLFGVPYTLAWIGLTLTLRANFNGWFIHLKTPQIISLGLFGALFTAAISDYLLPCKDKAYRGLKFVTASGVILLVLFTYLANRNVDRISWQWLLTSGILSLGTGLYFRYLEAYPRKDAK